jgi:hypothetical protein
MRIGQAWAEDVWAAGVWADGAWAAAASYDAFAPVSDVTDGSWLNEAASNVNLYASIDEASASDADYIQSSATATTDTCEVALANAGTPGAGVVTLRVRYGLV